jgi:SseB protein N-terminal domain
MVLPSWVGGADCSLKTPEDRGGSVTESLGELLAGLHAGATDGEQLVAGVREALLVVPTDGDESVLTAEQDGARFLYAFTSTEQLARFAAARGEGDREWSYLTVRGSRLAEVLAPELGTDAVLAVDVAGPCPGLFPASVLSQGKAA